MKVTTVQAAGTSGAILQIMQRPSNCGGGKVSAPYVRRLILLKHPQKERRRR